MVAIPAALMGDWESKEQVPEEQKIRKNKQQKANIQKITHQNIFTIKKNLLWHDFFIMCEIILPDILVQFSMNTS